MKALVTMLLVAGALCRAQAGGVYVSTSVPLYPGSYWDYSYPVYSYSGYYPGCSYPYYPGYAYEYTRPNYAVNGTLLGALTGGLIGATQHSGWEGAGIGAAAGLLLGGVAEIATEKRERNWAYAQPAPPPPPAPPAVVVPRPGPRVPVVVRTTVAPPKSFYQIPDAPRVPNAPTF